MQEFTWSVRHMQPEALDKLLDVQEVSGGRLGDLLCEAIDHWHSCLPEEPEEEASIAPTEIVDIVIHEVGHNIANLKNESASHLLEDEKS